VTRHHSCRVTPFGHPRIHARLTAPRGISQPPTSFIGSRCQGIHHAPLNTYKHKNQSFSKIAQKNTPPTHGQRIQLMLATTIHKSNTTPHHQDGATTPGVASGPNSVFGVSPLERGLCCCAPSRHPLQASGSSRLTPHHDAGCFSWCSLERR
jgi:hypothetical protein